LKSRGRKKKNKVSWDGVLRNEPAIAAGRWRARDSVPKGLLIPSVARDLSVGSGEDIPE
jgi:hypothetical protein